MLREYSQFSDKSGVIRERMNVLFAPRMFSPKLISRLLNIFKSEVYGNNGMSMNKLMETGRTILTSGGVFETETEHDDFMRLKSLIVQSKEMRKYAEAYNDYCILNGTHCPNQYRLVLMPVSLVDCLGKSIISSIGICEAETKSFSSKLMRFSGLVNPNGTRYIIFTTFASFSCVARDIQKGHLRHGA